MNNITDNNNDRQPWELFEFPPIPNPLRAQGWAAFLAAVNAPQCTPTAVWSFAGHPVVINDVHIMAQSGFAPGVPSALAALKGGTPNIVINNAMLNFPVWMVEAIMWHEVGHIELHAGLSLWTIARSNSTRNKRLSPLEQQADEYACAHTPHMQLTLELMHTLFSADPSLDWDLPGRCAHMFANPLLGQTLILPTDPAAWIRVSDDPGCLFTL